MKKTSHVNLATTAYKTKNILPENEGTHGDRTNTPYANKIQGFVVNVGPIVLIIEKNLPQPAKNISQKPKTSIKHI